MNVQALINEVLKHITKNAPPELDDDQVEEIKTLLIELWDNPEIQFAEDLIQAIEDRAEEDYSEEEWDIIEEAIREHW